MITRNLGLISKATKELNEAEVNFVCECVCVLCSGLCLLRGETYKMLCVWFIYMFDVNE